MAGKKGFTLIEIVVVVAITTVMLGVSAFYGASWLGRSSARSAAQVFSRDLAQARAFSVRSREWVRMRFFEDSLVYRVESQGGRLLARRAFDGSEDVVVSTLDLQLPPDSLRFDRRGLAEMSGLGVASFVAGERVFDVSFNATGASRVAERRTGG